MKENWTKNHIRSYRYDMDWLNMNKSENQCLWHVPKTLEWDKVPKKKSKSILAVERRPHRSDFTNFIGFVSQHVNMCK